MTSPGALVGVRVLDISNIIAGPYCAGLLADFGADVIKIELPGRGDASRHLGTVVNDASMIWRRLNRGKRTITLDLRGEQGQALFKRLLADTDVLVQNFLPGTLDKWGLGQAALHNVKPDLIMVSVSGFGQTGDRAHWPGVARTAMAYGGIMDLTGDPNGPPLIPGSSGLADYLTGMYAAFGALLALRHRDRTGQGQEIDAALYESVFSVLGDHVETFDLLGQVAQRMGSMNAHAAPHNNFRSADGKWVAIGCTSNHLFARLCVAMGRPELPSDDRFLSNELRVEHREAIEGLVAAWTATQKADDVVEALVRHGVPASLIYTVADAFADEHYWQRETLVRVPTDDLGQLATQGVVPRLTGSPGRVGRLADVMGRDNDAVYRDLLGLSDQELAALRASGVI